MEVPILSLSRLKARVTREWQLRILFVLNELLPPVIRDSRWCGMLLLRLAFGREAETFATFKDRASAMTDEEFSAVYVRTAECLPTATDLNRACLDEILAITTGPTVLEVGCGLGLLAGDLAAKHHVTACDIIIDDDVRSRFPDVLFEEANAERLPYADNSFDTVVCTHTIEHVRNLNAAVAELRRVARSQLIVVVPAERPYKYTFNLHLHFFPYPHTLRMTMGGNPNVRCDLVGGDLLFHERFDSPS